GRPTRRSRTVSAVRSATSRTAREVAHPQLFPSTLKGKPVLYFAVKVAHPPHPQLFGSTFKDKPALYFPRYGAHPPRSGTPPVVSVEVSKTNLRYTSLVMWPTRHAV